MPTDPPPAEPARRDAWLAELWPPCRELPKHERDAKRTEDRRQQKLTEEWSVDCPHAVDENPQAVA